MGCRKNAGNYLWKKQNKKPVSLVRPTIVGTMNVQLTVNETKFTRFHFMRSLCDVLNSSRKNGRYIWETVVKSNHSKTNDREWSLEKQWQSRVRPTIRVTICWFVHAAFVSRAFQSRKSRFSAAESTRFLHRWPNRSRRNQWRSYDFVLE